MADRRDELFGGWQANYCLEFESGGNRNGKN